ncbi:flagellar export protein FliJ [Larsenimonas rhizosphaerae]|uniref:Flagellar FliJ protein n=1 Tax=Larsenimonas rhizosphaerae TaxID=2944682 RepID=A0AA41ZD58_9GAMM|nr:flagellar export protein FliJ [Larsenimonas rhizosphaerae]MCM2130414.1 flagella biosynthesis chaperone FliJ [Larsenimonas rhizosphaerae]MCX2523119.1 flagellar export protein FliJ [Larsenimonas rhizosphaerae]
MASHSSALDTLIDLETSERDNAAQQLGKLRQTRQQSQKQLDMLLEYRSEYRQRLDDAMKNGISMNELQNYQSFIVSLDQAIEQQRHSLNSCDSHVSQGVRDWQHHQQRLNSYDVLATRRREEADESARKQEQHQSDEFASRAVSQFG